MHTVPILFAIVFGFTFVGDSLQYVAPTCFGQVCPASTTNCKEHKESSTDRSRIQVKISCLDDFDASVKEYYFEEASHLERNTFYKKTRFESINEGISRSSDPYSSQSIYLTPQHRQSEYF